MFYSHSFPEGHITCDNPPKQKGKSEPISIRHQKDRDPKHHSEPHRAQKEPKNEKWKIREKEENGRKGVGWIPQGRRERGRG